MKSVRDAHSSAASPDGVPKGDGLDASSFHSSSRRSWIREVSRYQWLVLVVAWLGWVFDSMDGTLYSLVQRRSMVELMGPGASAADVAFYSRVVLSSMLLGWAIGGIGFGALADYIGRTRALTFTVLIYSAFTGLSALSQDWWHLAGFRFITGLGLGGEWAAGAALVAEVWPDRLRARAGGILQSAAGFGFFFAATISLAVGDNSWRYVYLVGAAPALFVLVIRLLVKEPEAWVAVREERKRAGADRKKSSQFDSFTLKQLFTSEFRRDTLLASSLAFVVLLALWGATVWIPAAVAEIARTAGLAEPEQQRQAGYAVMLLNAGSLPGYLLFGPLADRVGRRAAFMFYFLGGVLIFPFTFAIAGSLTRVFVLLPFVGFFTLGVTSGFPIYLPELFPTRIRTTGVGFCYNLGRIVTAAGVFLVGYLSAAIGSEARTASAVSLIYLLGLLLLPLARETRGQRLV